MLIELYVLFTLIGFTTLILSFITSKKDTKDTEDGSITEESRGSIPLFFISFILFSALAYSSFEIQSVDCQNQIDWINITSNENQTQLTNNVECLTTTYVETPLAYLFMSMGLVSIVMALLISVREGFTGYKIR